MNNIFQENKKIAFVLLGLFFLLLIIIYALFYRPLSLEVKSIENQIVRTEQDIGLFKAQIANASKGGNSSDGIIDRLGLAAKMPMTPELEKIILTLEEFEVVSGSRVDNISFSYDGSIPERVETEEDDELPVEETEGQADDDLEVEEETSESELETIINLEEKPENLQVINVSLNVSSPDYKHFQLFIQEIEKQERMMTVSSMEFEKPTEEELLFEEEADESIMMNLTITTFYYEQE